MAKRRHIPEEFQAAQNRLAHAFGAEEAARVLRVDVDDAVESLIRDAEEEQVDFYRAWAEGLTQTNCGFIEYQLGQLVLAEIAAAEGEATES